MTKYENFLPEEEVHRMGGELLLGNVRYIDPMEFIHKCAKKKSFASAK